MNHSMIASKVHENYRTEKEIHNVGDQIHIHIPSFKSAMSPSATHTYPEANNADRNSNPYSHAKSKDPPRHSPIFVFRSPASTDRCI